MRIHRTRGKSRDNDPLRIRIGGGIEFKTHDAAYLGSVDHSLPEQKLAASSALLGFDFPRIRHFDILVDDEAYVRAGEPLARDRRRPDIIFTSPISGQFAAVRRGDRRRLVSMRIDSRDRSENIKFDVPDRLSEQVVRRLLQQSGLWTALRARPFGDIPDVGEVPEALFVTAIDTRPLAPNPAEVVQHYGDEFKAGVGALRCLVSNPEQFYVCQGANSGISTGDDVRVVEFEGHHPAGLPGVHIHALSPIGFGQKSVWHINYQDVISLGHMMLTGVIWTERIVSLAGSAVRNPRLLKVPAGASLEDLTRGELIEGPSDVVSGSMLRDDATFGHEMFLGQRHCQITATARNSTESTDPSRDDALIPVASLEAAAPPGVLAIPLLRSLLVADIERARDLGALELVEEDLALLSHVCPTRTNYGRLLADVLDQLLSEDRASRQAAAS